MFFRFYISSRINDSQDHPSDRALESGDVARGVVALPGDRASQYERIQVYDVDRRGSGGTDPGAVSVVSRHVPKLSIPDLQGGCGEVFYFV